MIKPKTILVVEDEGVVARQLQLTLSDLGYNVPATAASAAEAIRLAEDLRPDLALMDIHLEGAVDGIETAAVLRQRFDVPVVYLTAFADASTIERAKATEPYGYLVKPVDDSKLEGIVEIAIHKHTLDRQLRASEAKFAGLVETSSDAIISIDAERRISLFNQGAEAIFGYSAAEVLGAPLDVLIPERLRSVHRAHVEAFAAGDVSARRMGGRSQIVGKRKNGDEFPAEASISKITVEGYTILTAMLRDVSERERIASEQRFLAKSGAAWSSALDLEETLASVVHLVAHDLADWCAVGLVEDGRALRWKVASADPANAPIPEVLGRAPGDVGEEHPYCRVLETKQPLLVPDGTALGVDSVGSVMAVPLMGRARRLGALIFARARQSRAYEPKDLSFAEAVGARAALAIEGAQLYEAAQRAIEARDLMLGIVAHDLRNPLIAIQLQAQMLLRREPEGPGRNAADAIARSTSRIDRLVHDLLDVSQIQAGRLRLTRATVPVGQVVSEAATSQELLAGSASLALRVEVAGDTPAVWADRGRLLQVFENLVGNAIKFTPRGGSITIGAAPLRTTSPVAPGGAEVLFWVADTGLGIASGDLPHIFDRFWRAGKARDRGAGLGLPIVEGIVLAHGGRIWCESALDSGSTFYFTIPI